MRILHELNQLDMGGAERVVLGIIKHDKENEHTVYTYKEGMMRKPLEDAGAKILIEDDSQQAMDVDIIHIHTGGAESHIANAVQGNIKTVETIHSPVVSAVRPEYVCARVGVSNVVTKINRKCRTIYNGIDIKRLENGLTPKEAKARLGIPEEAFVVGRLGRLGYDKCLEDYIVACWKFQKSLPANEADNMFVIIAGNEAKDAKGYLGRLKIMAASLPLKNVVFVESTEDVAPIYTAMDVFLYPSPTEGFGLVYMEAMACGVPVLTWKNDVTNELLTGHAMLVDNSIKSLSNGLTALYKSKSLREQFGELGQSYVVTSFTDEVMSKKYQEFYKEVGVKSG